MDKEFKLASQLLLLLDSEQRWFTLAEVEKAYIFQIRPYVSSEEINRQLPVAMTIDVSRGKGIFLQRDGRSTTVSEVLSSMFRQTIFYRFMHLLFINGQHFSMEELAEAMYMSTSSLKKLIMQLNNHDLKPYKLRITYSTPAIKGNELNIRYFYWKLYGDAYEYTGWPFTNSDADFINQCITHIEHEQSIVYFINSKRKLSF